MSRTPALWTSLFWAAYEARPGLWNIAIHEATTLFAQLKHHPFNIRTHRDHREALRSKPLIIRVAIPRAFSHSAYIKNRMIARLRTCLAETLRERGWNFDGIPREGGPDSEKLTEQQRFNLTGAYFVMIVKETEKVLNAEQKEFRHNCHLLVDLMIQNSRKRLDMDARNGTSTSQQDIGQRGDKQRRIVRRSAASYKNRPD